MRIYRPCQAGVDTRCLLIATCRLHSLLSRSLACCREVYTRPTCARQATYMAISNLHLNLATSGITRRLFVLAGIAGFVAASSFAQAQDKSIIVASTTSTQD